MLSLASVAVFGLSYEFILFNEMEIRNVHVVLVIRTAETFLDLFTTPYFNYSFISASHIPSQASLNRRQKLTDRVCGTNIMIMWFSAH